MENKIIGSNELTENQLHLVHFLFNYIIPESKSFELPGGAILLDSKEVFTETFKNLLDKSLFLLEGLIKNKSKIKFNSKCVHNSIELIDEFKRNNSRIFNELSLNIISFYYSNTNVLKKIGIKSIPPFPDGNSVLEGDLLLLEPVFIKEEIYRKT
jgi:hypothetical protein